MPRVLVAIQGYYDRSGQEGDARFTLAGYMASPAVWAVFEGNWAEVLRTAPVTPCAGLHMRDANRLQESFSWKLGWTKEKVDTLIWRLIRECIIPAGKMERGLFGVNVTVETQDWKRAALELPAMKSWSPVALCAEVVARMAIQYLPPQVPGRPAGTVELFFDRNEPFEPEIKKSWNEAQDRPEGQRGALARIASIVSSNDSVPGIQAADYFAWHLNRWYTDEGVNVSKSLYSNMLALAFTPCQGVRFTYDKLVEWFSKELIKG